MSAESYEPKPGEVRTKAQADGVACCPLCGGRVKVIEARIDCRPAYGFRFDPPFSRDFPPLLYSANIEMVCSNNCILNVRSFDRESSFMEVVKHRPSLTELARRARTEQYRP